MTSLNTETITTVKTTETADVASLLARVNGNGHTIEPACTMVYQNHRTFEHTTKKPRRAVGPQIVGDECVAVLKAEAAVFLRKARGLSLKAAAKCTGSNIHYVLAWQTLEQAGAVELMTNAKAGCIGLLEAARVVKHLAMMKTGFAGSLPSACKLENA